MPTRRSRSSSSSNAFIAALGIDDAGRRRGDRRRPAPQPRRARRPSSSCAIAASRSRRCSTSSTWRSAGRSPTTSACSSTRSAIARARTSSCGRWRSSSPRRRSRPGVDQQLGPLNPYERRLVHLAVAEVPGVTTESIGDAFSKTVHDLVTEVARARGRGVSQAGSPLSRERPCSPPPTPSSPLRRRRAAAASASCGSAGRDAHAIARALIAATAPLRAAARDVHARFVDVDGAVARSIRSSSPTFPRPHSYTGDDVVEISAHGSPVVLRAIVDGGDRRRRAARRAGRVHAARVPERPDRSVQAEAVADLIDAVTPLQARAAFDQLEGTLTRDDRRDRRGAVRSDRAARSVGRFSRRGLSLRRARRRWRAALDALVDAHRSRCSRDARRGRLIREGLQVAIVGKPNVGKSSLFNALVGAARAIVTDVPGTTRDLVTEVVDLDGLRVTLVDTAGLRETADVVEAEGVARARQAQRASPIWCWSCSTDRRRSTQRDRDVMLANDRRRHDV